MIPPALLRKYRFAPFFPHTSDEGDDSGLLSCYILGVVKVTATLRVFISTEEKVPLSCHKLLGMDVYRF